MLESMKKRVNEPRTKSTLSPTPTTDIRTIRVSSSAASAQMDILYRIFNIA